MNPNVLPRYIYTSRYIPEYEKPVVTLPGTTGFHQKYSEITHPSMGRVKYKYSHTEEIIWKAGGSSVEILTHIMEIEESTVPNGFVMYGVEDRRDV